MCTLKVGSSYKKKCTLKVGSSYKNFSLGKSLISDATHRKICKLHMHMSLTEDINEINEIPPQS